MVTTMATGFHLGVTTVPSLREAHGANRCLIRDPSGTRLARTGVRLPDPIPESGYRDRGRDRGPLSGPGTVDTRIDGGS